MLKIVLSLLLFIFLLSGCAGMKVQKSNNGFKPLKDSIVAIVPFYNYTQTPLVGFSAAAISNVVMKSHKFQTMPINLEPKPELLVDDKRKSNKEILEQLQKRKIPYLLTGKVTEWRYKAGIDAEPVVGLIVEIIDTKDGKVLYSSSASNNASYGDSLANNAQDILDKILP